jgi:hypothetical protein
MPRIAFLTLEDRADFVIDDALAIAELDARGVRVDEVPWLRADVDWRVYEGIVIRTTWDYQRRFGEFMELLDRIEAMAIPLANSASLVRWNARKTYLADLAGRGVRVVPTERGRGLSLDDLRGLRERIGADEVVLKPLIGANADDTFWLSARTDQAELQAIAASFQGREWMAQPFVSAILQEGEYSLFYFDGRYSHAVVKRPAPGDFRVQEEHGGLIERWEPDADAKSAAGAALAAIAERPLQARIDLVRMGDGGLALMELELIEPSLYFRMHEDAPGNFADAVEEWLRSPARARTATTEGG